MDELIFKLKQKADLMEFIGSQETVNPPPEVNDYDILVYCKEWKPLMLLELGFEDRGENENYGRNGIFSSWRRGNINVIYTQNLKFFKLFVLAAKVCKLHNFQTKEERVQMHNAIIDLEF